MLNPTRQLAFHRRRNTRNMDEILIVRVKTNQPETKILEQEGNSLKIALVSKPIDDQANYELLKFLQRTFKKRARLASGRTTNTKIVELY